jgi:hypothetical protein
LDATISAAIRTKHLLAFDYGGHHRVAEPHVYGRLAGVDKLLAYQVDGTSSTGGLPQWRRFDLHRVTGLTILEETFAGPRPNRSGEHSSWDVTYEIVA